jgi:hypothetical protein
MRKHCFSHIFFVYLYKKIMGQPVRQIIKEIHPEINEKLTYTLLVDGNMLLRLSFKDESVNNDGIHYGGIFQFLLQLKILLQKKDFDYVIKDTPPLGSVIDAAVIAKKCDASMLVVSADRTSRSFVRNVIHQLKAANPNFLGVVLNKVNIKKSGYYYGRKYGGYYGY